METVHSELIARRGTQSNIVLSTGFDPLHVCILKTFNSNKNIAVEALNSVAGFVMA